MMDTLESLFGYLERLGVEGPDFALSTLLIYSSVRSPHTVTSPGLIPTSILYEPWGTGIFEGPGRSGRVKEGGGPGSYTTLTQVEVILVSVPRTIFSFLYKEGV